MIRAAETTLAVLEMPNNQALLVAHRDTDCAHVHVIANRVSWEDGRAAKLTMSRLNLSRWAEGYERSRGEIQCARRVEHNRIRSQGQAVYDRESRRDAGYRREDSFGRERYEDGRTPQEEAQVGKQRATEQQVTDQCQASMKERRESIDVHHKQQWRELYQRQEGEREDLEATVRDQRGRMPKELDPDRKSQELEQRHVQERAGLGRRHAHTAQLLKNLYAAKYAHDIYKTSSNLSFRMASEKGVTVAKQELRAALRSELSGENRSGGGAPVKIKGLDDDEEEYEHSWGR